MALLHSPAEIVKWALIELTPPGVPAVIGTDPLPWQTYIGGSPPTTAWPVFHDAEPPVPDNCMTVKDTVGYDNGRNMVDGEVTYHYGFQVRVRAVDHKTGWRQANAVRDAFQFSIYQMIVSIQDPGAPSPNTYLIYAIAGIGEVLPLGKDRPNSERSLFTVNAVAAMRQLT